MKIGLVIMASGLGKRFGGNKLMASLGDKPLIKWIIDSTEGLFDRRVVVTRSDEVKALCDRLNIECIMHALPNRNDTVRLGLAALMESVDYCFFTPADQPLIKKNSITKLIEEARNHSDKIVRTCFDEKPGSPVGFARKYFEDLLNLPEGKGGNWIAMRNLESICYVEVLNEYELYDIDTQENLYQVQDILRKDVHF